MGIKSTSITPKAHAIAINEANRRKANGMSSSITAVISEAVVKCFGNNYKKEGQNEQ